ncbi:hypothetical protein ACIQXW_23340 [Lysinibacillus sp. NPDC097162]|uniref:hypothetical protein n=1 Tax=Lysinibacillus sp. NPDC097162 TaxID=3364140 RepID=UPI00380AB37F
MALSKSRILDMAHDIANTVEHGEALYGCAMLAELLADIDRLRTSCIEYAKENGEEESE